MIKSSTQVGCVLSVGAKRPKVGKKINKKFSHPYTNGTLNHWYYVEWVHLQQTDPTI